LPELQSHPHREGSLGLRGKPSVAAVLVVLLLAAILVATALWPELDIALARLFYEGAGKGFALRSQATLILLRELGYYLPIVVLALAGLVFLLARRRPRRDALRGRRFLFLALSFALGPGLLVNGMLKEISHRPRPAQIVEFGGPSTFRAWYAADGACEHNCSFASGEVAGATWLVAPASLLPPPWRALALGLASAVTVAVAALRMAFGGHFASDAAAAVLVTLASIFVVGWAVLRKGGEVARFDAAPPHS
jgi:membrane-associated PAP2 superfamily phosphatase